MIVSPEQKNWMLNPFAWIQRFPYQLEKIWLLPICLGATALVLMIAWATVGALTFKAARNLPVRSLRYE